MVSPVKNLSRVQIYQCSYHIADSPSLTKVRVLNIPLLHSVAIVCVRVWAITNAITIVKVCVDTAPAYLHESIGQKSCLIVKCFFEDGGVCSDRHEIGYCLYIEC